MRWAFNGTMGRHELVEYQNKGSVVKKKNEVISNPLKGENEKKKNFENRTKENSTRVLYK